MHILVQHIHRIICIGILGLLMCNIPDVHAQTNTDSLQINYSMETVSGISSQSFQPHWQVHNRYGLLEDRQADAYILAGVSGNRTWNNFNFRFGMQLAGKPVDEESHIHQAYLSAEYGAFNFRAGRKRQTHGLQYDNLSTGSLAISNNARPIPRVSVGIDEFTSIPLTWDFLAVKGQYTHGWFEEDRPTASPWLHEKFVYFRGFPDHWPVVLYGGIVHYAVWGGENEELGNPPARFEDYMRLIFARSADPDYEGTENFPGWVVNAIGDHLGMIEFAIKIQHAGYELFTYRQIPFEDGSGLRFYSNKDFLHGFHLKRQNADGIINGILFENIKTYWQSGPGPTDQPDGGCEANPDVFVCTDDYPYNFGGQDQYYNHSVYQKGWSYNGHTLGSSLLMNKQRGRSYFGDAELGFREFVSNRIRGFHLGLEGKYDRFDFRVMTSRIRYMGNYQFITIMNEYVSDDYVFASEPVQYHTMLELTSATSIDGLQWTASLGLDFGDLGGNSGIMAGVQFRR